MTILLEAPFDGPSLGMPFFANALRPAFARTSPRSLILPSALSPESAASLRAQAAPLASRFELADRGSYAVLELPGDDSAILPGRAYERARWMEEAAHESATWRLHVLLAPLLGQVRAFAEAVSGQVLLPPRARLVWFEAGDYSLRQDDARLQAGDPRIAAARGGPLGESVVSALDAQLDLSLEEGDPAATVYSAQARAPDLLVAQRPGQLALVERTGLSSRWDRYRSRERGKTPFVLLRATFPLAEC